MKTCLVVDTRQDEPVFCGIHRDCCLYISGQPRDDQPYLVILDDSKTAGGA